MKSHLISPQASCKNAPEAHKRQKRQASTNRLDLQNPLLDLVRRRSEREVLHERASNATHSKGRQDKQANKIIDSRQASDLSRKRQLNAKNNKSATARNLVSSDSRRPQDRPQDASHAMHSMLHGFHPASEAETNIKANQQ